MISESTKNIEKMTICRVLGASTKIIDKWDEIAFMRDVIIAGKDVEVDDARKLLKDTKDKQKQLGNDLFYFFFIFYHI